MDIQLSIWLSTDQHSVLATNWSLEPRQFSCTFIPSSSLSQQTDDSLVIEMLCVHCEKLTIDNLYKKTCNEAPIAGWSHSYLTLYPSYNYLDIEAKNGCETCKSFQDSFIDQCGSEAALAEKIAGLNESTKSALPIIAYITMGFPNSGKRPITKLILQVGTKVQKATDNSLTITFRISKIRGTKERASAGYVFRYTHIDHDLASEQNFTIAKNWIRTCCDGHDDQLCPPIMCTDLPTRLIDVGAADGSQDPKLVQPPKGMKRKYIALSHCWGPSTIKERLLTKGATLEARMKSIPLSSMPANFHDATIITRRLGYQYLWIDSLCIIQDSKSDWATESSNMGNIYTRASLTIAAAAAKDSDGGMLRRDYHPAQSGGTFAPSHWFLTDRKEINNYALPDKKADGDLRNDKLPSCSIRIHEDDASPLAVLTPWMEYSDLEENWFRCTVVAPLAHRGWCLQERLLSRRILYYGARQMYWQCACSREAADGEIVPVDGATSANSVSSDASEWPDLLGFKTLFASMERDKTESVSSKKRIEMERRIYRTWHNILYLYINRRLTYQSDKLPGLAGMATFVGRLTGDLYIAGFWRRSLLVSLVWTPMLMSVREYELRSIAERYEISKPQWEFDHQELEGPSWSWASADIKDKLYFWADHKEEYQSRIWEEHDAEILEVDSVLMDPGIPYGRVKSGHLILRGFVRPKYDVRTSGWDPHDILSSIILSCCPHSPWSLPRPGEAGYQHALWDYGPRQKLPSTLRLILHVLSWLLYTAQIMFLEWRFPTSYAAEQQNSGCSSCNKYLRVHMLSLVNKNSSKLKSEVQAHEVDLWSLILEPVPGEPGTYRRIGISREVTYLAEAGFHAWTGSKQSGTESSTVFSSWQKKTVTII